MKAIIIITTNMIHFLLSLFTKNLFWTWKQYKKNRIDAANNRNNTNTWFKSHPVKPRISFQEWFNSVKIYFTQKEEVCEEIDITFDNL